LDLMGLGSARTESLSFILFASAADLGERGKSSGGGGVIMNRGSFGGRPDWSRGAGKGRGVG
jgi:hypothetical protein